MEQACSVLVNCFVVLYVHNCSPIAIARFSPVTSLAGPDWRIVCP